MIMLQVARATQLLRETLMVRTQTAILILLIYKDMKKTKESNWMMHADRWPGRVIHPTPLVHWAWRVIPSKCIRGGAKGNGWCALQMYASPKSLSGCYQHLTASLLCFFCPQGCATSCYTASKPKGGHKSIIVLMKRRLSLLTTLHTFLNANARRVWGVIRQFEHTW